MKPRVRDLLTCPVIAALVITALALPGMAWSESDYEAGAVVLKRGNKPVPVPQAVAKTSPKATPKATPKPVTDASKSGLATRLGFGQPADDVSRIRAAQALIYPWVRLSPAKAGQGVRCRVLFHAQSGVIDAADANAKTDTKGTAVCAVGLPDGMTQWPSGRYTVEFLADGKPAGELNFTAGD
ncbi:MAG: hypothetical protein KDI42_10845 [Gammaproteobacteria bacterium]|nr:hypothetical protein [Gammaproteobacteria bacterium]